MKQREIELLAPAGTMTCLHAAVSAGADAVYLGVEAFNARRGAENFTLESLGEACDYAHLRGVRIYLTLNTVILPSELPQALELARQAYRKGVDAFIVQDIGLAAELHRTLPAVPIHASTQMNIHTCAGLEAVQAIGAQRATLARELSLEEIEHIGTYAQEHGIALETFVHGALCVCHSGQCFMSSLIGRRSANRGMCAQACRLPYSLHNKAVRKILPAEGDHLLSPQDLCAIDLLPRLIDAGVRSFKIEGRMKSAEYVFTVTSVYRHALDRYLAGDTKKISEHDRFALAEVFSRGFTSAYLEGQRGNDIMGYGRPNNRGVFVGRVESVRNAIVSVSREKGIHEGDVLEFWTNKGHVVHRVEAFESGTDERHAVLRIAKEKMVGKGDRVFCVRRAERTFIDEAYAPLIPVEGKIVLKKGEPLQLSFIVKDPYTQEGIRASVEEEGPLVEAARTKAIEAHEVREHIGRFGNTPFVLTDLALTLDEEVGIGFSRLHALRAQALEHLQEALLEPYRNRILPKVVARENLPVPQKRGCLVAAWVTNPVCARAAKRAGAEQLYVPALFSEQGQAVIAGQVSETGESAKYPAQSIVALPVVEHDRIEGTREYAQGINVWDQVKSHQPVFVENIGQLQQAVAQGALAEVGPHVPVCNAVALQAVTRMGAERVWLSPELSLAQIEELGAQSPVPLGLTVAGLQELMTTEHCLLMSQGSCTEECQSCPRRKSPHYLKDRKGYEFPLITDCLGRSHLYNAVELDLAHAVPDLLRAGITALLVDTTMMNGAETTQAIERVVRARNIALRTGEKLSKREGATTGHLFRGVQ